MQKKQAKFSKNGGFSDIFRAKANPLYALAIPGFLLILLAFLFNSPKDILLGNITILKSPANLLTDYIKISNTGAAFFSAGLVSVLSVVFLIKNKAEISGLVIASVFMVLGFSLFGKNIYNTIPIVLGVYLYAKLFKKPFKSYLLHAMFGTALSPLVSEVSFNLGFDLPLGLLLGTLCGIIAGFLIPILANHCLSFHKGLSLYNIGFTAGLVSMVFVATLRGFGVNIQPVSLLSSGNNAAFALILYSMFVFSALSGLYLSKGNCIKKYFSLLKESGQAPNDFYKKYGLASTLINMGLMGILCTSYVLILGGQLNGPVMGGIFAAVGFGASGKHIKNSLPILLGVLLANLLNIHEINAPFTLVAAMFGTCLAPVSGVYGFFGGVLAGFLHMALVTNVGFLHAGVNLYNNGFSGGFVAAFLYPLFEAIKEAYTNKKRGEKQ